METQITSTPQEKYPRQGFMQRNKLSIKIILIGVLILLLFIPLSMVRGLISERSKTAMEASNEVQDKWSSSQQIVGPFISIPFYEHKEKQFYENGESKITVQKIQKYLYILPEILEVNGNIETEKLNRGLYEIVVYKTPLELKGTFILPQDFTKGIDSEELFLSNATINMGISDLRGIKEQIEIQWGDETLRFYCYFRSLCSIAFG